MTAMTIIVLFGLMLELVGILAIIQWDRWLRLTTKIAVSILSDSKTYRAYGVRLKTASEKMKARIGSREPTETEIQRLTEMIDLMEKMSENGKEKIALMVSFKQTPFLKKIRPNEISRLQTKAETIKSDWDKLAEKANAITA